MLAQIIEKHHRFARRLAEGCSLEEIAAEFSLPLSRAEHMAQESTMQNLVAETRKRLCGQPSMFDRRTAIEPARGQTEQSAWGNRLTSNGTLAA